MMEGAAGVHERQALWCQSSRRVGVARAGVGSVAGRRRRAAAAVLVMGGR